MILGWKTLYIKRYEPKEYGELISEILSDINVDVVLCGSSDSSFDGKKGYAISSGKDCMYIDATCGEMLYLALSYIKSRHNEEQVYSAKNIETSLIFPAREAYIHDIELFTPVWRYLWQPPSWLLDYEEKKASFPKANRPMCWAHRGGGDYYPENSIEAIISSIYMGADIMELDFRYTKDKRIVLMHYDTLHQSTDWEYKKGKNGLPESDLLADWTYDELTQLRLKAGRKFRAEAVTEYIIPTLEDVLYVCNGRAFFIMDKMNPAQEWENIYASICNTKCYEAFTFAYKMPEEMVFELQKDMINKFGKTGPYFYLRKHAGSLERELISKDERLNVFREFSQGNNTAIMTNYVQDLVTYIDEEYGKGDL